MVPAVNDTLFPLEATPDSSSVKEEGRAPVAKTFRPYDPQQILLLPPSLDEWLPEGHLARFVSEKMMLRPVLSRFAPSWLPNSWS